MPELRQNFFTKDWVVIATERAKRPEQLIVHREPRPQASFSPNCPFCPGNENQAPPELLRLPKGDGSSKVRVIPNKFAALARQVPPARTIHRSRRTIQGFGVHTVLPEAAAQFLCNVKVDATVGAEQAVSAGAGE